MVKSNKKCNPNFNPFRQISNIVPADPPLMVKGNVNTRHVIPYIIKESTKGCSEIMIGNFWSEGTN